MDSKPSNLTKSIIKLQSLREKLRITEEAQINQQKLRMECEEKTEKLIAENDDISFKLLERQKITQKYKDLVETLLSRKVDLERKLQILQGRAGENEDVECQNLNKNVQSYKAPLKKEQQQFKQNQYSDFKERIFSQNRPETKTNENQTKDYGETSLTQKTSFERNIKSNEVEYDQNEEIWELKKSIEDIESQLIALEQQKQN